MLDGMNLGQSELTPEERQVAAKRLVAELDAEEQFLLVGLGKGMSRRAIAATANLDPEDVERTLVGLMAKLNANSVADLVRVAIYANLSLP
jgi:DNA-binding NarL/FixJ family response regulator